MEGSATMLTLPRVLSAQLPGVGKDTETPRAASQSWHPWLKPHGSERPTDVTTPPAHAQLQNC